MHKFDKRALYRSATHLSAWKCLAFMAYCCERMVPNYRRFEEQTGWGDTSSLRHALEAIWEWIEGSQKPGNRDQLIAICEQQAPDTGAFSSRYTSAANDAAVAIAITLEQIPELDRDQLVEVASLARDSVDIFVQQEKGLDPSSPSFESEILSSDLMQRELKAQWDSLDILLKANELNKKSLRASWSKLVRGSLG